ncbi:MAG TPA: metallopeptidase family protein [Kofleriaceae bacterium]|jgi:tetratricopeptide (TPR) repeat protein
MARLPLYLALVLAACGGPGDGGNKKKSDDAGPGLRGAGRLGPLPQSGAAAAAHADSDDGKEAVICPLESDDPDAVLDETGRLLYDVGDYEKALACAELSVDLVPQAVEAHHYRAAALAALGRYGDAQVAFAMALARDPDDPETLAAAADFYINIALPKQRSSVQLGLEYARRGSGRAASRRRLDRRLRARLFLLEAEALNDLGQSDTALSKVDAALKLSPRMSAALHERGVTLFSLCRFRAAEEAFLAVLREHPDDPYAHHHLGLIYERENRDGDAEAHFARARALAPDDFAAPVMLSAEEFRAEVDQAIAEQPPDVRADLGKVSLELSDMPALDDLVAVEPPFAPTIMGLYRGLPLGVEEGTTAAASPGPAKASSAALDIENEPLATAAPAAARVPDRDRVPARAIVLYRKNLARAVRSREELDRQIRRTLIHEIGHLRGLDEDDLRRRGLE